MKDKPRICLLIEGSYPYITGGVSSWVHQLIEGLPDFDFSLFTISPSHDQPIHYDSPTNVKEHIDIVISEKLTGKSMGGRKSRIFQEIEKVHGNFATGSAPDLSLLVEFLGDGRSLHDEVLSDPTSWHMLTRANDENNPVYPFSEFYWAWRSAHDMMFTVLGAEMPQADIYHAVSTGYAGLAAAITKIRTGKSFLLTEHGLYHKEREMEVRRTKFVKGYQRDMWIKIYNNMSRLAYRYADKIISLFEYNRRKQIELGALDNRCLVIPNGIDTTFFSNVKRKKRAGFHVGLVGRVVPIKDIKTFIAMAKVVSGNIPDAVFHCIGPTDEDPGYFEDCQMLVKSLKLTENFHFTGRQDVREYYSFLDVVLLTSVREAQPLVILEAYCVGVPVVSTQVGNVPELLDFDDRFLAPSKDAQKLAEGIQYIHDHPAEIEQIVEKNRDKVYRFYDRNSLHDRYRQLYQEAVWQESASN